MIKVGRNYIFSDEDKQNIHIYNDVNTQDIKIVQSQIRKYMFITLVNLFAILIEIVISDRATDNYTIYALVPFSCISLAYSLFMYKAFQSAIGILDNCKYMLFKIDELPKVENDKRIITYKGKTYIDNYNSYGINVIDTNSGYKTLYYSDSNFDMRNKGDTIKCYVNRDWSKHIDNYDKIFSRIYRKRK